MDKFESQFADLDVQTSYMEDAMQSTTATSTPQDQVEQLLRQTAEENNIELQHDLASKESPASVPTVATHDQETSIGDEDARLAERLRALRPASWLCIMVLIYKPVLFAHQKSIIVTYIQTMHP